MLKEEYGSVRSTGIDLVEGPWDFVLLRTGAGTLLIIMISTICVLLLFLLLLLLV